jgi:hypothetical protein
MTCNKCSVSIHWLRRSAAVVLMAATAYADFTVPWWTIDAGGEMWATGGDLELSGTIGQPDASTVEMTGGDFELTGGFWAGAGVQPFCFGDLDGDLDIDLADLAQLLGNYGTSSGAAYEDGDLDGDGDVDLADLAGLLAVYGTTCE